MAANLPDKITLWILEDESVDPEYFGKVDVGGAATLEALRVTFEVNDILEWPFEFWDFEDKRPIRKRLEKVNAFSKEVHVIRVEGDGDANKRQRLADGSFTVSTVEVIATKDEAPEFLEIEVHEEEPTVGPITFTRSFRVANPILAVLQTSPIGELSIADLQATAAAAHPSQWMARGSTSAKGRCPSFRL